MTENYIHGFSKREAFRLLEQAELLAPRIFDGLDLSGDASLLELGCGIGVEMKILLDKWPDLKTVGLDLSSLHLAFGKKYFADDLISGRMQLVEADAYNTPFEDHTFDVVLSVWFLEHVDRPEDILKEAFRVLKPGGRLVLIEVDNNTFRFEPESSAIKDWWDQFNRFQQNSGGDPNIGPKLKTLVESVGGSVVSEEKIPAVCSKGNPELRNTLLQYLHKLLLSGADSLHRAGLADAQHAEKVSDAFDEIQHDNPDVHFQYHAIRLIAQPPQ